MSDEKIIVSAHRDGYFEGAADNASGLATLVGLAEYFTKLPKEKRPRTMCGTTMSAKTVDRLRAKWQPRNHSIGHSCCLRSYGTGTNLG